MRPSHLPRPGRIRGKSAVTSGKSIHHRGLSVLRDRCINPARSGKRKDRGSSRVQIASSTCLCYTPKAYGYAIHLTNPIPAAMSQVQKLVTWEKYLG